MLHRNSPGDVSSGSSTVSNFTRKVVAAALVFALAGVIAGCGSDDDEASSNETEKTTEAVANDKTDGKSGDDATAASGEPVVISAKDYAFEGVPESVPAGTKLTIDNQSKVELHEVVAIRIPDQETRPVDELAKLPESELEALFGAGPPAVVLLQAPGGEVMPAVGDGTLDEPGRYALICSIPVGVDPEEYLKAGEEATDGPPQVEGAGPPHFTQGMYAELMVE